WSGARAGTRPGPREWRREEFGGKPRRRPKANHAARPAGRFPGPAADGSLTLAAGEKTDAAFREPGARRDRGASRRPPEVRDAHDLLERDDKTDAVSRLVQFHLVLDRFQDPVGLFFRGHDEDQVLGGLDGNAEERPLLVDPAAPAQHHGGSLRPSFAGGVDDVLCRTPIHNGDDEVKRLVVQLSRTLHPRPSSFVRKAPRRPARLVWARAAQRLPARSRRSRDSCRET